MSKAQLSVDMQRFLKYVHGHALLCQIYLWTYRVGIYIIKIYHGHTVFQHTITYVVFLKH